MLNRFLMCLWMIGFCLSSNLFSVQTDPSPRALHEAYKDPEDGYDLASNPFFSSKERKRISLHLLPSTHPIKPILDAIFLTERATLNEQTFAAAGFTIKFHQPRSFIKVASHPLLPGYLLKVYLDDERRLKQKIPGWQWFVNRVVLAKKIAQCIKKNNIEHFIVPKKWIYPLPVSPFVPIGYARKNEVLVVEEMKLCSQQESIHAWKTLITKEHLDEFYAIFKHCGGSSYRPDNVVYTQDGKFAFIDTEYVKHPPYYWDLCKYLSPEMAAYWQSLYHDIL